MSKVVLIAAACHTFNAALCAALGEAQPSWVDAPEDIKNSAIAGVEYALANPDVTPEQQHEAWMEFKAREGWTYGEVKDAEKKTHPCMVPYDQLPALQKAKDHVFRATVHFMKALHVAGVDEPTPGSVPVSAAGFTPIKYIGRRESYRDGTYGTGIVWVRGETKSVPAAKAAQMLRHPDVWVLGEEVTQAPPAEAIEAAAAQQEADKTEEELQDHRDRIATMDKDALVAYAEQNFRQKLDKRRSEDALRSQVVQMIDQYGVA